MFKVVLVCSTLVREGTTNVIYNMLEAHSKAASDVEFSILTLSPEEKKSRSDDFKHLHISVESINIKKGPFAIFHLREIRKRIQSMNPDVCHSYGFRADIILSLLNLGKILKISSLFNYPYDDYKMLFGKWQGYLMAKLHLKQLRKFKHVTVCSKFIFDKLQKYNLPLSVIYTGVPTDFFVPLNVKERSKQKEKLGIPHRAIVYIFIANLIPRKNPEILVEVFSKLKMGNALLLIMGDGELLDRCKEICNDDTIIRYLGRKSSTLEYLQISDFYISPSLSEGFPTAVLEAMSVGLIPILSNILPHSEMLSSINEHYLFSPYSEEELLSVLFRSLNDKREDVCYRAYLQEHYSSQAMFDNYVQLYKRSLSLI